MSPGQTQDQSFNLSQRFLFAKLNFDDGMNKRFITVIFITYFKFISLDPVISID